MVDHVDHVTMVDHVTVQNTADFQATGLAKSLVCAGQLYIFLRASKREARNQSPTAIFCMMPSAPIEECFFQIVFIPAVPLVKEHLQAYQHLDALVSTYVHQSTYKYSRIGYFWQ